MSIDLTPRQEVYITSYHIQDMNIIIWKLSSSSSELRLNFNILKTPSR